MYEVTVHWLHGRKEEFRSVEKPQVFDMYIKLVEPWRNTDTPHERYLVLAAIKMFEIYSGDA